MVSFEEIISEADFYLNNDVTITDASTALNISRRTLQIHLKKLQEIAPEKYKLVEQKKQQNIKAGNIKGGSIGKRGATWTREEAISVAALLLSQEMTYKEAEEKTGIPSSTIHDMVHKGLDDNERATILYALAEANRRGLTLEEFAHKHSQIHVSSDLVSKQIISEKIGKKGK